EEESDPVGELHHEVGRNPEKSAYEIEDQNDVAVMQPHAHEAMVDVVTIRLEGAYSASGPTEDGPQGIQQGHAQHDDREDEDRGGARLQRSGKAQTGKEESEEHAPCVAEKNLRRIHVEGKEPKRGPSEDQRQDRHDRLIRG